MPRTNPALSYDEFMATVQNLIAKHKHAPPVDELDEDETPMGQIIKQLGEAGLLTEKELTKAYVQATLPAVWNKQDLCALRKPTT